MERVCNICGTRFDARSPNGRFCSEDCRERRKQRPAEDRPCRTPHALKCCTVCGIEFLPALGYPGQPTCSHDCAAIRRVRGADRWHERRSSVRIRVVHVWAARRDQRQPLASIIKGNSRAAVFKRWPSATAYGGWRRRSARSCEKAWRWAPREGA
jgi:hypothetical protein